MQQRFLITGASGQIGRVLAEHLARLGHSLVLSARHEPTLATLAEKLNIYDGDISYCCADFSEQNTLSALIELASSVELNGAVIMPPRPASTDDALPTKDYWQTMFNTSFIAPVDLITRLMPHLIQTPSSRLVLISGISSLQPMDHYATSNTLRTAWTGFSKTLADHYGPHGLHVNTLSLGGVMTEVLQQKIEREIQQHQMSYQQALDHRFNNIPLKRYAKLEEIADFVVFLLCSKASEHLTGQNIAFDGGYTRCY